MSTDVPPALHERYEWLSWTEAAAYLDITVRQLRRAVEGRKVGHTRTGRELRFSKAQLDAFVAASTFTPGVDA